MDLISWDTKIIRLEFLGISLENRENKGNRRGKMKNQMNELRFEISEIF